MREYIEFNDQDLKNLKNGDDVCEVYSIAIYQPGEWDADPIDFVRLEDYDRIVDLYNACIDGLKEKDLTWSFSKEVSNTPSRFFR